MPREMIFLEGYQLLGWVKANCRRKQPFYLCNINSCRGFACACVHRAAPEHLQYCRYFDLAQGMSTVDNLRCPIGIIDICINS